MIDFKERFIFCLTFLVGKEPPEILVDQWLSHSLESEGWNNLQNWVLSNLRQEFYWVQGIAVIDAAHTLASQPEEGDVYE